MPLKFSAELLKSTRLAEDVAEDAPASDDAPKLDDVTRPDDVDLLDRLLDPARLDAPPAMRARSRLGLTMSRKMNANAVTKRNTILREATTRSRPTAGGSTL